MNKHESLNKNNRQKILTALDIQTYCQAHGLILGENVRYEIWMTLYLYAQNDNFDFSVDEDRDINYVVIQFLHHYGTLYIKN